jgi:hypothetical protein
MKIAAIKIFRKSERFRLACELMESTNFTAARLGAAHRL